MNDSVNQQLKIAVIGDVHDQWESEDEIALERLEVDLVLFVGDFGNESVQLVKQIANLKLPKAAILGNHDAWYTASDWGRKKSPYDHQKEDRVQQQLDLLGEAHVGYGKIDFPQFNLSVVGSRPFSWGGPNWTNSEFYGDRYGINNFQESTQRIVRAAEETICDYLIILGHNGPVGLGDQPEDSCGRDWHPLGGDYGDPDLTEAIAQIKSMGKQILLVTFGHMHHRLRHTQSLLRKIINKDIDGVIYFNAASVPRIKSTLDGKFRNFSLVYVENYQIKKINLVWLAKNHHLISEKMFYYIQE